MDKIGEITLGFTKLVEITLLKTGLVHGGIKLGFIKSGETKLGEIGFVKSGFDNAPDSMSSLKNG